MKKSKIELEYNLKSPSLNAVWIAVGTPAGMSEWFADQVVAETDRLYSFFWEENKQQAKLIALKPHNYIRFQWLEDEQTDVFFEIRLTVNELTNEMVLHITDFVLDTEKEDAILVWNKQIEIMQRKNGLYFFYK
ncbi:MAG: START-like domain-containing protein [Paludibacter sp.]|nr:START-like domain-containing protein [Paludibacter sp.]